MYYITYGAFQAQMKDYYLRTSHKLQFPEMMDYLYRKGLLSDKPLSFEIPSDYPEISVEAFNRLVDSFPLSYVPRTLHSTVEENELIPVSRDVFAMRHPRYTRPYVHRHNYFEINYVISGTGVFTFRGEERIMKRGELCIIAPGSLHDLRIDDDSTVISFSIRKSTFDTSFFSLLSRQDPLSCFFRNVLQGDGGKNNYLMFFTGENPEIRRNIRALIIEAQKNDMYSNSCLISHVNLLFSELLRTYSRTVQFYNYTMGSDFSLIMQYIQYNYQRLTLSFLSDLFHYSEPHLCALIKQNTGYTFTELIRRLRLADAVEYLQHTNLKIGEIAERVGYNSSDHFSRVFRGAYHMSPQQYRKQNQNTETPFVPFATEEK